MLTCPRRWVIDKCTTSDKHTVSFEKALTVIQARRYCMHVNPVRAGRSTVSTTADLTCIFQGFVRQLKVNALAVRSR